MVDFLGTVLERDFSHFGQVLDRSQLFSGVDTRVVDHPQADAKTPSMRSGYIATIYLALISPSQVGWYMLRPGADQPAQIDFDHMAAAGAPRLNSWVAAIARNAQVVK
jgi:hypothetical protein